MDDSKNKTIEDGQVVSLNYTLTVDGEVVDTSEGSEPIQFIQGEGQIIPGLEEGLYGLQVGDKRQIVVPAETGYGQPDPENYADIPRSEFPANIPLQPGVELEMKDQDGEVIEARIASVHDDTVRLDFNHPLAGKELHFAVEVVNLRDATEEEMDHGHVHS
jgi:FKBP-type peptidyl-prolyl cis-trans isomerase SlyD